ncbi:MAG: hypothetical protein AABO57_01310 [Acidobacteriota bacterium]
MSTKRSKAAAHGKRRKASRTLEAHLAFQQLLADIRALILGYQAATLVDEPPADLPNWPSPEVKALIVRARKHTNKEPN